MDRNTTSSAALATGLNPKTDFRKASAEGIAGKRISVAAVRELCGGVSDMTIWRWLADPGMDFPRPIYIARRRYWREDEVLAWLDLQADEQRGAA